MKDNKEVKKLCRMLDAAGIAYEDTCKRIIVTKDNNSFAFDYLMILQRGAKCIFGIIRNATDFKGNDWDGLKNRLEESEDWELDSLSKCWSSAFAGKGLNDFGITFFHHKDNKRKYWSNLKRQWCNVKPHKLWQFLDKVDKAKSKGGKQTVKFKGCEYEFDFPVVEDKKETEITVPFTANQLTGQAYKDKDDTEQQEWRKVTNWESARDLEYWDFIVKDIPFATKMQTAQILAFSRLTLIHKAMMDATDESDKMSNTVEGINFKDDGHSNYTRIVSNIEPIKCTPFEIEFHTASQREHFIKHNERLINQYLGK